MIVYDPSNLASFKSSIDMPYAVDSTHPDSRQVHLLSRQGHKRHFTELKLQICHGD